MRTVLLTILFFLFTHSYHTQTKQPDVEPGVSYELARFRKNTVSEVKYELNLKIPENKSEKISGIEKLTFNYKKQNNIPLQVDFKEDNASLLSVSVNGKAVRTGIQNEHIVIDSQYLKSGFNQVDFEFLAGNSALNRRDGYLYTLFVPDRARTMFPCFDQPNLKATYSLTLTIPEKWNAMANGKLKETTVKQGRKKLSFAQSDLLPTYLFSFAAGDFKKFKEKIGEQDVGMLYRETDSVKIKNSMDSIYSIYRNSLAYYEKWTGIPHPFQKHGLVVVPDFQFGGMEHPGAILFQNSTLFLDKNATQSQLNNRSNLLAHEVAHLWFGDMVTMDWFNDVWMKEVFANFMADKSTGASSDKSVYNLKFLTTHFPAAYSVDRTLGANPIRQVLDNLQNAGMMYGPIIYSKAPIMMRQLELLIGEDNFRKGVGEYLKKYAYRNATWPDLINILDKHTPEDLQSWNKVWVNDPGRPVIDYQVKYKGNKIDDFTISQHPEYGEVQKSWPQEFRISLFYPDKVEDVNIKLSGDQQHIPELKGKAKPLFILQNSSGIGYGVFRTEKDVMTHFSEIKDPVSRASAYISLYENMLNGFGIVPQDLLHFYAGQLQKENTELNLRLITGYISSVYWNFLPENIRLQESEKIENIIWQALQTQTAKNNKKILFDSYQGIFQSKNAYNHLYKIWKLQTPPQDVSMNDEDYTGLALSLSLRNAHNSDLLQEQLTRIKNPDRINRFKILMNAVSSDENVRNNFFEGLSQKQNRANESAVGAAVGYLHHPLRQKTSINYLPKTLSLLQEIQKTGDIFFPDSWLRSSFGSYQNPKALEIVKQFISQNPDYNAILKNKILQATDNLRRAQLLVK
ncbi:aminopeptidase [Elizabethkingia meningoseptica]|uniref:M1 family aminopeptidase n=1 Tax=Elizabethkingia meningoseptica TaxID=238 RepID=UPI000332C2A5|nr:M1 family aminopeptidase [Elizabethkingia meningoseptica]AQX03855.1 aminopeptidase [Elizabethkingia meningoseptica]AQX45894.1 aminopeptidase [Elizabethkingia meningoseptica]EOR28692.1 aminopeptidase [Elizabethkingia meningoseptica ATCC 13253 = NBRC 12535]KUY15187.1 aminopeptidase [Elizabethkingia meningoseptica]MDE5488654.1 aminopeptidase [Elizabethkingia meningoseptica]